jgi:hypothetical protein
LHRFPFGHPDLIAKEERKTRVKLGPALATSRLGLASSGNQL